MSLTHRFFSFFFFNDTATTEIYTLSLHDALPISPRERSRRCRGDDLREEGLMDEVRLGLASVTILSVVRGLRRTSDRKSTRLNSSHSQISYAVFCLKKKKKKSNRHIACHSKQCTI